MNSANGYSGGALHTLSDFCEVVDCIFEDNTCGVAGGAIYGQNLKVVNSRFRRNTSGYSDYTWGCGGAIFGRNGENTYLRGCEFVENSVANRGGAVYAVRDVRDCIFSNNVAKYGGALAGAVRYGAELYHCLIVSNRATIAGGGLLDANATDCILRENYSERAGAACWGELNSVRNPSTGVWSLIDDLGGSRWNGRPILTRCRITHNIADDHQAVCASGELHACLVASNVAYRAVIGLPHNVANASTNLVAYNCVFDGNRKVSPAGTSPINQPLINRGTYVNCTFVNNENDRGAVLGESTSRANHFQSTNCLFVSNATIDLEGGLHSHAVYTTVQSSPTLSNCIQATASEVKLNGSTFPMRYYGVQLSSVCHDAGLEISYLSTDFYGQTRTIETIDIGAVECQLGFGTIILLR